MPRRLTSLLSKQTSIFRQRNRVGKIKSDNVVGLSIVLSYTFYLSSSRPLVKSASCERRILSKYHLFPLCFTTVSLRHRLLYIYYISSTIWRVGFSDCTWSARCGRLRREYEDGCVVSFELKSGGLRRYLKAIFFVTGSP